MHIHIGHHFYGAGNCGDDWILAGFVAAIASSGIKARLTCCAEINHDTMARRFPTVEWLPYTPFHREKAIAASSIWLGLGGTPFQLDSSNWMNEHLLLDLKFAAKHGKPAYMLGIGIEDLRAIQTQAALQTLTQIRHIWTRDESSTRHLVEAGVAENIVSTGADLANLYLQGVEWPQPTAATTGLIFHVEKAHQYNLRALIDFVSGAESPLRWIVQEVRTLHYSEMLVWHHLPPACRAKLVLSAPNYLDGTIAALLEPWMDVTTCLSTRYHGALAAAWRGARVTVYPRSTKIRGLAEQLGCSIQPSLVRGSDFEHGLHSAAPVARATVMKLAQDAARSCQELFLRIA